jgi:cell division protein FtsW (lipid II flippase)
MYSVSIYESFSVTKGISNYFYFQEHLQKISIGLILAIITWFIPWKTLKKRDIILFVGSFLFLLLLFTALGENKLNDDKNARLWLYLP